MLKVMAGAWHPDGTREHDWFEAELVVEMRPRPDAVADVFFHPMGKPHGLSFAWTDDRAAYECRPPALQ